MAHTGRPFTPNTSQSGWWHTTATAPTKRLALRRTSIVLAHDDQSKLPGRLKRWLIPKGLNGIAEFRFSSRHKGGPLPVYKISRLSTNLCSFTLAPLPIVALPRYGPSHSAFVCPIPLRSIRYILYKLLTGEFCSNRVDCPRAHPRLL